MALGNGIASFIGGTPLVRLERLGRDLGVELFPRRAGDAGGVARLSRGADHAGADERRAPGAAAQLRRGGGIGGGIALMPILIYGYGFPLRQAAGTGILALVGASLSAQAGAVATRTVAVGPLRPLMSLVLISGAAAVAWNVLRRL
jgi:hypothetical protein